MSDLIDEQYLECCSCRCTPSLRTWIETNRGAPWLGISELPEAGFPAPEDWDDFKYNSGCRLDCPECGTAQCVEDTELY